MTRWSLVHTGDSTLLHRAGYAPVWAFAVTLSMPIVLTTSQRSRMAHQIRQDIWRACRHVRGFLPLVQVSTNGDETVIRAGGSLATRSGHADALAAKVARVLDCGNNISRWQRHARRARG